MHLSGCSVQMIFAHLASNSIKRLAFSYGALRCLSTIPPHKLKLEDIRNIGISAHIDSGKTTLTERLLYYAGRIGAMHEVKGKDGVGATMDFMELERARGITIQSAATTLQWCGKALNVIDTPGHVDFTVEVSRALRVLDGAVLVLCAVGGVQSQTLTVHRQMARYKVPAIAFLNKVDRTGARPDIVIKDVRSKLGFNAAFLTYPIGIEKDVGGIIDIINQEAIYYEGSSGETVVKKPLPSNVKEIAVNKKRELIEALANVDEEIGDIFLNEETPTDSLLKTVIKRCCKNRTFLPVFSGSALKNTGVQTLLDGVLDFLPHPGEVDQIALDSDTHETIPLLTARTTQNPLVCFAFKLEAGRFGQLTYLRIYQGALTKGDTIHNTRTNKKVRISRLVRMHASQMEEVDRVLAGDVCAVLGVDCSTGDTFVAKPSMLHMAMQSIHVPEPVVSASISPKDSRRADNFSKAIARFVREDPTFKVKWDPEASQTIASGMGELHLEVYAQRMENEYGCPVELGPPKVAYRETILQPVEVDYVHRQQHGGQGQYGRVTGWLEPLVGKSYLNVDFVDKTTGTNVPKNFMNAIARGFRDACECGSLVGARVTGIQFRLVDGDHHPVDSTDRAFYKCAYDAVKQFYDITPRTIIEPIMLVEASCPFEFTGQVQATIISRGGEITKQDSTEECSVLTALVPLANMFGYVSELRSVTQGKGEYSMEYEMYKETESHIIDSMISEYQLTLKTAAKR